MSIKGWNKKEDRISTDPIVDIEVSKGEPRTGSGYSTRAGVDLKELFRLKIGKESLRKRLIRIYKTRNEYIEEKAIDVEVGNSKTIKRAFLYVKTLNIIASTTEIEKVFRTDMLLKNNKQQKLHKCDREKIYHERYEYVDWVGGKHNGWRECDRPCQADPENIFAPCKLGCKPNGDLYFFMWELMDEGYYLCRLNTSSITDVIGFPRPLYAIEEEFGSIRTIGQSVGDFRSDIPLVLSRFEVEISRPKTTNETIDGKKVAVRTGEKTKTTTWKLNINVNPVWKAAYYAQKKIEQLSLMGQAPSPQLVGQIIDRTEFVPSLPAPKNALPSQSQALPSPSEMVEAEIVVDWQPTEQEKQELFALMQQFDWSKQGVVKLLDLRYGLKEIADVVQLGEHKWYELKQALVSSEARAYFCD